MRTATRWQVVTTAAAEIGYTESGGSTGHNGNITKYWEAHYPQWQGQPWCGAFVHWVLAERNSEGHPIGITGIFYTPSIVNAAKAQGIWRDGSRLSEAKPGDLILFDFDGGGWAKHVGFVEKYVGEGVVQTIEGNTSPTNAGSQNNGGGVYRRRRSNASAMGFVDMSQWLADDVSGLEEQEWVPTGTLTTAQVQELVGTTVDGVYGPSTIAGVKEVQEALGLAVDGLWGKTTEGTVMSLLEEMKALSAKIDTLPQKILDTRVTLSNHVKSEMQTSNTSLTVNALLQYAAIGGFRDDPAPVVDVSAIAAAVVKETGTRLSQATQDTGGTP